MVPMSKIGLTEEDALLKVRAEVSDRFGRLASNAHVCGRCGKLRLLVADIASFCRDKDCPGFERLR